TTLFRSMMDTEDHAFLAAAVEVTLELLDAAERHRSFSDDENEQDKLKAIKRERRRYEELRARLVADEHHGVPVALEFLEQAPGVGPTSIPDDVSDEHFAARLDELRPARHLHQ